MFSEVKKKMGSSVLFLREITLKVIMCIQNNIMLIKFYLKYLSILLLYLVHTYIKLLNVLHIKKAKLLSYNYVLLIPNSFITNPGILNFAPFVDVPAAMLP